MSAETDGVEETTGSPLLEAVAAWYHVPAVALAMLFMFWTRVQNYGEFITESGEPALAGVDSWYHWRTFQWTAEHYPQTMPFDVWTSFPTGKYVGQFGTLFDQLVVTAAMIVGLGDPSTETLYLTALFAVPAMATLVAVPVFFMGRRLGGTAGGLAAVALVALPPGSFFGRTTAGQFDHHAAEVLFMALALLGLMVALRVAERERPIWELVRAREWEALRPAATYSLLAGAGLALYVWVWPPAVTLIGIVGVFFAIQLCLDYLRGVSPDHVAFVGAIALGLTAVVSLLLIEEPGMGVTSFGYLQPALAGLVALGCLFVAWLAREWSARDIEREYFPLAVGGLALAAFAAMALVVPELFDTVVSNVLRRILPVGPEEAAAGTIQEAARPTDFTDHAFEEFGMAFYSMLAGLAILIARPIVLDREFRAEHTLVLVWALFLLSMGMTQIRFAYYLLLPVAVVNAVFVGETVRLLELDRILESVTSVKTYQVIAIVLVVGLLFVPLLPPMQETTTWEQGNATGPHPDAMVWQESNHWLANNTPAPGDFGGAGNADELDYLGHYAYPEDGDYDYPEGAYGVMAWWDYGHLITTQAKRIPHANPFQSNAVSASAFLTAQSEERAEGIMEAIGQGIDVREQSTEELAALVENGSSEEEMRYVMIDTATAADKMPAITRWQGPDYSHYTTPEDFGPTDVITEDSLSEEFATAPIHDTMASRLYYGAATGLEHYRLVHENTGQPRPVVSFALTQGGRVLVDDDGVPAIEVNRMVTPQLARTLQSLEGNQNVDVRYLSQTQEAPVKTFERVEGATLTGSVDPAELEENASVFVYAAVTTNAGNTVPYTQEADLEDDGSFSVTVPYATDNELGVEDGYTDTAVSAVGEVRVGAGTVNASAIGQGVQFGDLFDGGHYAGSTAVPESAVVFGESVDVDLEYTTPEEDGEGNETAP